MVMTDFMGDTSRVSLVVYLNNNSIKGVFVQVFMSGSKSSGVVLKGGIGSDRPVRERLPGGIPAGTAAGRRRRKRGANLLV
jgi:hypothetical protein